MRFDKHSNEHSESIEYEFVGHLNDYKLSRNTSALWISLMIIRTNSLYTQRILVDRNVPRITTYNIFSYRKRQVYYNQSEVPTE